VAHRNQKQESLVTFGHSELSQSLEIGLRILRRFSPTRPNLGIADLAEELNMSRPTTHRYVITLVACGFLEQGASRKYRLASRVSDLGMSVLGATGLPGPSRPYLNDLRKRVGYTVSVAVLDGDEIVYVARACSHRRGQYHADSGRRVGSKVPASCTAMGKVLVAGLSEEDQRDWMATTKLAPSGPNSIVSKTALQAELERVRHQGFAINDRELVASMVAVAVPVQNGGTVTAAIGIAANANVISVATLAAKCRDDLLVTAGGLAEHLGYEPPAKGDSKRSVVL
jgi:IclR family pca regulon transcriptional regulator